MGKIKKKLKTGSLPPVQAQPLQKTTPKNRSHPHDLALSKMEPTQINSILATTVRYKARTASK